MRWAKQIVLLALLVALSAAMWVTFIKKDDGTKDQSNNTSTDTTAPFTRLNVSSVGGSRMAPDGRTRIGFTSTCEGAVQAAASYSRISDGPNNPELVAGRTQTLKYAAWGQNEGLTLMRDLSLAPASPPTSTFPEYGGFQVVSCTPGKAAVVRVLLMLSVGAFPGEQENVGWAFAAERFNLAWLADDWRTTDFDVIGDDSAPATPRRTWKRPVNSAQRQEILAQKSGWQEFSNAPNK